VAPARLIDRQLEVLFARDTAGRLVSTRDSAPKPAPRVFLGRSRDGNAWALRHDVDLAIADPIERLLAAEAPLAEPMADDTPACRVQVIELLGGLTTEHRGPAYVLPRDLPHDDRARLVRAEDCAALGDAFPWLAAEFVAVAPVAIAFDGGEPAAICHAPRGMTAFVAEAGVETIERFRGRGLATAAVACWARAVQQSGRVALYSTTWDNAASRAVARRLGATVYGENWHVD
jgi:hypothetical protein